MNKENNNQICQPITFFLSNDYYAKMENKNYPNNESHTFFRGQLTTSFPQPELLPLEIDSYDDALYPPGSIHSKWHFQPQSKIYIDGIVSVNIHLAANSTVIYTTSGWIEVTLNLGHYESQPEKLSFQLISGQSKSYTINFPVEHLTLLANSEFHLQIRNMVYQPRSEPSRPLRPALNSKSEFSDAIFISLGSKNGSLSGCSSITIPMSNMNIKNNVKTNDETKTIHIDYEVSCSLGFEKTINESKILLIDPDENIIYSIPIIINQNENFLFRGKLSIPLNSSKEGNYELIIIITDKSGNQWFDVRNIKYKDIPKYNDLTWWVTVLLAIGTGVIALYGIYQKKNDNSQVTNYHNK